MRIKKIGKASVEEVVARVFTGRGNKKDILYFTVLHGGQGAGLHQCRFGVDKLIGVASTITDTMKLMDNDYILLPVTKTGEPKRDREGNIIYYFSKDSIDIHRDDDIIFWEIPNNYYYDVSFHTDGDVNLIAEGRNGKIREHEYISPAPVLEVYGDCTLRWEGTNKSGKRVGQKITRINGNWTVGVIGELDFKIKTDV